MAGEAEYTFVHALLRDVAYGELPRSARLARHRATAAWITDRAGAALGEDAEIVIAHLERALELATATGAADETDEIQVGLVDALLVAADNAMRTTCPGPSRTCAGRSTSSMRTIRGVPPCWRDSVGPRSPCRTSVKPSACSKRPAATFCAAVTTASRPRSPLRWPSP